jgi:hypothetical protein
MSIFRVRITGTLFGQHCENVVHFQRPESNLAFKEALARKIEDHWLAQMRLVCRQAMGWESVKVRDASNPDDFEFVHPINVTGFHPGEFDVWAPLCAVFQIKTAVQGRRGRGRFYLSGLEAVGVRRGIWDTGRLGELNSIASSLKEGFLGDNPTSGFNLGVLKRNGLEADFIEATDFRIRHHPGSQVRRNLFRGK